MARGATRLELLRELARAAGFAVGAGDSRSLARRLDLDLEAASVEEVLGRVLDDVPHHLHYEPLAPGEGEVALRRVTVGRLPGATPPVAAPTAEESPLDAEVGERAKPAPRNREDVPSEEERRAAIEAGRDSGEPGERARAAALMRPEEALDALLHSLAADPHPEVRASAAASLGEAEGGETAFRAGEALLAATLDPDPTVAAAAIRGLDEMHDVIPDPRFRARIARLASHPDPRVRGAAASFLEWTEDDW